MVNAAEDPASAAYVNLEMEVLGWVGKPIVLLLNQMGPPREDVSSELARWREIDGGGLVRAILPLDAFARCWVQEGTLLDTVAPLLDPPKQSAMARLRARWEELNLARFDHSMAVLGRYLARAAEDREAVAEPGWQGKLTGALTGQGRENAAAGKAMAALATRLAEATARSTDDLIRLHGLSGKAARQVLERVGDDYAHAAKAPEGAAAALGGLVSGAVGGLAADLAAGGLTLGGGMIVGGILGALGATGVAKGLNLARGEDGSTMRWSGEFFERLAVSAVLRYLAVAHFGRGRGEWTGGEHPAFWHSVVEQAVVELSNELSRVQIAAAKQARTQPRPEQELTELVRGCTKSVLLKLYPEASRSVLEVPQIDVVLS